MQSTEHLLVAGASPGSGATAEIACGLRLAVRCLRLAACGIAVSRQQFLQPPLFELCLLGAHFSRQRNPDNVTSQRCAVTKTAQGGHAQFEKLLGCRTCSQCH